LRPNFANTHFAARADFEGAVFKDDVFFDQAKIDGCIGFQPRSTDVKNPTTFQRGLYFRDAEVTGPADFRSSTFTGQVLFDHSHFSGLADFSDACFLCNTSFEGSVFRTVYFSESERILDNSKKQFNAAVDFRGCAFDRIYRTVDKKLNWHALAACWQPYNRQPYKQFESSFPTIGQDGIADEIYLVRCAKDRDEM
jgi:uncharacterized protein YjbI with pentapeptide repeats